MTALDEILMNMNPELFEDNSYKNFELSNGDDKLSDNYLSEQGYSPDVVHQENVPNELARAILKPNEFDPDCRYQLVTMTDKTLLLKINEYAPVEDDNPVNQRITEFVLNTDNEVQTYDEMVKDIILPRRAVVNTPPKPIEHEKHRTDTWLIVAIVVFALLVSIGVGAWWILFNILS